MTEHDLLQSLRDPQRGHLYGFSLRTEKRAPVSRPGYGSQGGKYLTASIPEPGSGREADTH